jgi:hypothetical protein
VPAPQSTWWYSWNIVSAAGWGMVCGLSGRGPLFQGYWPTGQPGSASYWRTRNGSYSVRKFNYFKNCFLSVHWTALTNFRIKYLKYEVLMGVRVTSCGTWRREKQLKFVPDYSRGVYIKKKSSLHLKIPNTRRVMWSQFHIADLVILSVDVQKSVHTATWRPGLCTPRYTTSRHRRLSSTHAFV